MDKKIRSVEELFVYQKAREFSRKISELIKQLPEIEKFRLKDQMRRAKLSLTNNIAEGYVVFIIKRIFNIADNREVLCLN